MGVIRRHKPRAARVATASEVRHVGQRSTFVLPVVEAEGAGYAFGSDPPYELALKWSRATKRHGIVTETADASAETLRLMSIMAAVNCGLAALGVAIAYYVYFYVPHSLEVHYAGRYDEVVSSAATYISVFPVFQIFVFVLSVIGR